ncbi:MAG: BrnA antitoxin family protein [Lachnospiraceae bacterium]|nr:BrnA antitoxin family protein [Lachnospiraceae bacterium]
MAIRKYVLRPEQQLTEEQILMVKAAAKRSVAQDEDNPELTDEQLASLRRVHESRRVDRRRQNVTLRLTPQTIQKAKALGKGYSGILSRIIESVLNDPSALSKYL